MPKSGQGRPNFEFGLDGGSLALFRERIKGSGGLVQRAGYSFGITRLDVRHGLDHSDEYGNTAGGGRVEFDATSPINVSANSFGTVSNALGNHSPYALPPRISLAHYAKALT